jgi:hypothetical protein
MIMILIITLNVIIRATITTEVQIHKKVFDQTKLLSAASPCSRVKHSSAGVKLNSIVG